MIYLTRLNGAKYVLNCDLIEMLEATPDTVITTTNGNKWIASETVEEIISKVIEYKRKIYNPENLANKDIK
jgi:flagellar protein FlbD